jgi:hypothetical protein
LLRRRKPDAMEADRQATVLHSMGSSRFLKAIRARHRNGALVVKVFVKPDAHMDLRPLSKRIAGTLEAVALQYHVLIIMNSREERLSRLSESAALHTSIGHRACGVPHPSMGRKQPLRQDKVRIWCSWVVAPSDGGLHAIARGLS